MWIMHSILVVLLLAGSVSDARIRVVDNRISYSVMLLGLCRMLLSGNLLYFFGGVLAFLLLGTPALLGKGIGGADVKIAVGLGCYFGMLFIMRLLLWTFLLALCTCFFLKFIKKKGIQTIPLIPFMFAATLFLALH